MLPSILNNLTPYNIYTEDEYNDALGRILKHKQSIIKFKSILESAHGVTLNGDYTLARISHNYFTNCTFDSASLQGAAGTGSIFNDVNFLNTNIVDAGFSNSTIDNCYFENCKLNNSNLSNSYISNTDWKDCELNGLNLSSSYLKKCKISGEFSKPGNMNEAHFDSFEIENVRFTNLNLEYSFFDNMKMNNVILPFSQIPYIFGAIEYLLNTKDDVRISSHINKIDSISISEYIDVLNDMMIFYSYKSELFPLSNILLSFEKKQEALYAALSGMVFAAKEYDYRMCKNFAQLITRNNNFHQNQLDSLYNEFVNSISIKNLSEAEFFQYNKNIYEIKSILTENSDNKAVNINLKTNIKNSNSKEIGLLIEMLDEFTHLKGVNLISPQISISHNSPILLCVAISGLSVSKLIATAGIILSAVYVACKSFNEIASLIINMQTIRDKKNAHSDYKKAKDTKNKENTIINTSSLENEIKNIETENPDLSAKVEDYSKAIESTETIINSAEVICKNFNIYQNWK